MLRPKSSDLYDYLITRMFLSCLFMGFTYYNLLQEHILQTYLKTKDKYILLQNKKYVQGNRTSSICSILILEYIKIRCCSNFPKRFRLLIIIVYLILNLRYIEAQAANINMYQYGTSDLI